MRALYASAYQCATIYAQRGNTAKVLEWPGRAVRLPDAGLVYVKADPLMDPLRRDPHFQSIVRELRFRDQLRARIFTGCKKELSSAPLRRGAYA